MEKQKPNSEKTTTQSGTSTSKLNKNRAEPEQRDTRTPQAAQGSAKFSSDWIEHVSSRTSSLEEKIQGLITARPLVFLAGALVVGFITNKIIASDYFASKLQGDL